MKVGTFVRPANPNHPRHKQVMRIISKRETNGVDIFSASPLSNHPEWSISMAAGGFIKVDAPRGWENFQPVTER